MKKLIEKFVTISVCIILILFNITNSYAYSNDAMKTNGSGEREIIHKYFETMGNDWDAFAECYVQEQKESMKDFVNDIDNQNNHVGVLNIKKAEVNEIKKVKVEDLDSMIEEEYISKDFAYYVVGVDFEVYEDDVCFSNGVEYALVILARNKIGYSVYAYRQIANPEELLESGYEFEDDYQQTIDKMEARDNNILVNGDGKVFGQIGGTTASDSDISLCAMENPSKMYLSPLENTTVVYNTGKPSSTGANIELTFRQYCLGVTAGEVRNKSFNGEARRACIIAIKTYTWYYLQHPINPTEPINIYASMQSYKPEYINENPQVTVDYEEVKKYWMKSSTYMVFEANYYAGSYNGNGKSGGALYQNGARYLVANGYNFKDVLKYYYSYSDKSTGEILIYK